MSKDEFHFQSKPLGDVNNTQVLITYDANHIILARIVDDLEDTGNKRALIEDTKALCINFTDEEIRSEIDMHDNVKLHNLGFPSDIIIDEDLYLLFDDEDKNELEKFLNSAEEFLNNLKLNHSFDNTYKFESLAIDKYKPSIFFRKNLKVKAWNERLLYADTLDLNTATTKIFELSKENKSFLYYVYTDLTDYECTVKYNDDIKDELEEIFYYGDLDTGNFILFFIVIAVAILALLVFLYY